MAVLYKLYKIVRSFKDGRTDKANNHWFARAIQVGEVSTDKLASEIEEKCTLTKADIKGCIEALINAIKRNVQNSHIVRLDGLGTFKIGISSVGAESPGDFSVNTNITGSHIIFTPSFSRDPATNKKVTTLLQGLTITETPENKVVKL